MTRATRSGPYTHYNIGGNTKFWGSVLYRLRREDFDAVEYEDGISPGWPIDYDTLAPYYDRAELMYEVHGGTGTDPTEPPRAPFPYPTIPHASNMAGIVRKLRAMGLHPSPLPLGLLRPGEHRWVHSLPDLQLVSVPRRHEERCRVLRDRPGGVSAERHPSDASDGPSADHRLIRTPSSGRRGRAPGDARTDRHVARHLVSRRRELERAPLSIGERSSPERTRELVGSRRAQLHGAPGDDDAGVLAVAVERRRFPEDRRHQRFLPAGSRSVRYPLGQIQSQGRTHPLMAKIVGDTWSYKGIEWRHIPLWAYDAWVSRAVDWLAITEDLPRPENRVTLAPDGRVRLAYRANNVNAHERLVDELRRVLKRLGYWSPRIFAYSAGARNTTHQCGTMRFGLDPRTSVLDPLCRTHDVSNLFVVDASFFPSSAAVNPGPDDHRAGLRTADHIAQEDLRVGTTVQYVHTVQVGARR